jgi:hypothetical protein
MLNFSAFSWVADSAAAHLAADRYSRRQPLLRLPSWIHTKESRIWGSAA